MADSAFQTQFRQEYIHGFEQRESLLYKSATNEVQLKGNVATFLVADSGGAEATTRGVNGRIAGRPDNLTQNEILLKEYHDKPERTNFNLFSSQGDGRRIMQETAMGVIHRKVDQVIIEALSNATVTAGAAAAASLAMATRAKAILGNAAVPGDGNITAVVTPAYMATLLGIKEFASSDYVSKKPMDNDDAAWDDTQGSYRWLGVNWIEHPNLIGGGTNSAECYMYHRRAIGAAAPSELIQTAANYNEEDDYSYARCTSFVGATILQNSGIVKMLHDDLKII